MEARKNQGILHKCPCFVMYLLVMRVLLIGSNTHVDSNINMSSVRDLYYLLGQIPSRSMRDVQLKKNEVFIRIDVLQATKKTIR
ncbi:Uncharacterized protein TCM_001185 [Theobroma cacao]|uniref:Uncharacterized protein n=1 Tax=Theobroma cacao TaxID=3641 RepID=A0A061DQJ9_THECC|nr:Uncharacterized protein TCM_001185 [Theobroma cacao]